MPVIGLAALAPHRLWLLISNARHNMPLLGRLLLAIWLLPLAAATSAGEVQVPMPSGSPMSFSIPDEWIAQTRPTRSGQPHAARFFASDPKQLRILLNAFLPSDPDRPPVSAEKLRVAVEAALGRVRSSAEESDPSVLDLNLSGAHGYYFFVTDKNAKPGEYKYLLQAQIAKGQLTVLISAFMNGDPAVQVPEVLALLRSFRRE